MTDDLERRLSAGVPRRDFDLAAFRTALGERADGAGLVDVAVGQLDSPLGTLTAMVTDRGLVRLSYPGEGLDEQLAEVAERVSPRILPSASRTDPVRRQLDEYFAGRRTDVRRADRLAARARLRRRRPGRDGADPVRRGVELPRDRH